MSQYGKLLSFVSHHATTISDQLQSLPLRPFTICSHSPASGAFVSCSTIILWGLSCRPTFTVPHCHPASRLLRSRVSTMSALRKLRQARLAIQQQEQQQQQQQQQHASTASAAETAEEDDGDDIAAERQQRATVMQAAFSLLQEEEGEEEAEDEDEQAGDTLPAGSLHQQQQQLQPAVAVADSASAGGHHAPSDGDEEADSEHDDQPSSRMKRRPAKRSAKQPPQPSRAARHQPANTKAKQKKADKPQQVEHDEERAADDEDIDSLLAELDRQLTTDTGKRVGGGRRTVAGEETDDSDWSFLATQQKHLDSNNEIRARFGSAAVRGVAAAEREGEEKAPRGMARRHPQGAAVTAIARRQRLVKVGDDWPPMVDRGDLKMVRLDPNSSSSSPSSSRGLSPVSSSASTSPQPSRSVWLLTSSACPLFSFRYSSDYDRLQQEYLSAISSHDIQALLYFARQHPYHVDCCVQLSELSESQGEFIVAHAAIQRALHMYDLSLHRDFDLYSGRCRLDGDVRENRGLFVALARHAQMLGKKGYSRTAVEVCKLLLSLSPLLDPQCVALFIDYHAIRAHQYAWLLELPYRLDVAVAQMTRSQPPWPVRKADEQQAVPTDDSKDEKEKSLPVVRVPAVLLPNLRYARAMAAYHIEQQENKEHPVDTLQSQVSPPSLAFLISSPASSSSSASPTSTAPITSAYLLHLAVLLYPEAVAPLLQQSGHEKEVDSSEWKPLLARLSKLYPDSKYVDKLVLVYTERSGVLWKNDALIGLLLRTCQHIVHTLDTGTQSLVAFQQQRAALFPRNCPVPPAISQLQRAQFTDTVHRLPPEVLMAQAQAQAEAGGGGMLQDEDDGAGVARMSLAELRAALQANRMEGLNVQGDNPLIALLRSLLPWNVVAPQMQQHRPQAGDAGQEELLEELNEDDEEEYDDFDDEGEEEDIGEY